MGASGLTSHIHFVWVDGTDGGGRRAPIRNTWASDLSYVLYGDFFHSWSSEGALSTPLILALYSLHRLFRVSCPPTAQSPTLVRPVYE